MRFFEYQDQARRLSRRLVWLYLAAVVLIVLLSTALLAWLIPWSHPPAGMAWLWGRTPGFIGWSAFAVTALVLGGTAYKLHKLSRGGVVVAEELAGRRIYAAQADDKQRQLLNVVEEMAIAAGLPLPRVYVLPEYGINAFAAGLHRRDAVIGITEGALQQLNRDELQAVVAHEFSHILNGDMRLNMHLAGLLHGLMMIGLAGNCLLFGRMPHDDARVCEDKSRKPMFVFWPAAGLGIALMILGALGTVLAGWIQAAVSRQREYLADASAVQFTRQHHGLVGALHKIAARKAPRWQRWQAGEYAHFMFGAVNEDDWLTCLAATHPPILRRIERMDARIARQLAAELKQAEAQGSEGYRGWLAFGSSAGHGGDGQPLLSPWLQPLGAGDAAPKDGGAAQEMLDEVMRIHPEHMAYAAWLRQSLPPAWYAASQDGEQAQALVCALLLSADAKVAARQQALIDAYRHSVSLRVKALQARRQGLQPAHALPLIDLALPALAGLPENEWPSWQSLLQQLMLADQQLSLHEWCVWTVLQAHLRPHRPANAVAWQQVGDDVAQVLCWAAVVNHNEAVVVQAYRQAAAALNLPVQAPKRSLRDLQTALGRLDGLIMARKADVLQAALSAVQADGRIDVAERELMRALAAALRCPMPPLLSASDSRPSGVSL